MTYDPQAHGAHCNLCPLNTADRIVVPPTLNTKALRLVIVGEGPGRTEEKLGRPFAGLSGKFLDHRLQKDANVERESCIVTNAALCRGESDEDNDRAAECCAPRLLRELESVPPEIPIVALGKAATRSILGVRNIMTARGFVWRAREVAESAVKTAFRGAKKKGAAATPNLLAGETMRGRQRIAGRVVLPSLHPAFILRADTWKPIAELDFRRIDRVMRDGFVAGEDECAYRVGSPEVLESLHEVGAISCDIETDGIKPLECNILSIGFADEHGRVAEIWPWSDAFSERVGRWLGTCGEVVFHNGHQFDLIVLETHGVTW